MILRLIIYILFLCTLNGCVQGLAFLGPAFSYSQSGNIMQSAVSYGTNKALKKMRTKPSSKDKKNTFDNNEIISDNN